MPKKWRNFLGTIYQLPTCGKYSNALYTDRSKELTNINAVKTIRLFFFLTKKHKQPTKQLEFKNLKMLPLLLIQIWGKVKLISTRHLASTIPLLYSCRSSCRQLGDLKISGTSLSSLQMTLYMAFFQEGSTSLPATIALKNSRNVICATSRNRSGTCRYTRRQGEDDIYKCIKFQCSK